MKIETDADAAFGSWTVEGHPESIEFTLSFWKAILPAVMSDFLRLRWGGAEVGGVLYGTKEPDRVRIVAFRPLDCEHRNGPAFELSEHDEAGLHRLLGEAEADEELAGLRPVGWYHSTHRWLLLTPQDIQLYDRYFPEPWQVAMVFLRTKPTPCLLGFFYRHPDGSIRSSHREFIAREALSEAVPSAPLPPPEPEPEEAPEVAAPPPSPSAPPPPPSAPIPSPSARPSPQENPFARTSHPAAPYWSPQQKEVLATLLHGIRGRKGLMVLSGEGGTGKTALLECLGDALTAESIEFAFLDDSGVTVDEFYQFLAYDLDLRCPRASKLTVLRALNGLLLEQAAKGRTTALLVDGAEQLEWDVLEEIQQFDNFQTRKGKLLQTILCGRPEFERRLDEDSLRRLEQRIALRCHIEPFQVADTVAYIADRLARSGMEVQAIFPQPLLPAIHLLSGGIPSVINAVCERVLDVCLATGGEPATMDLLEEVCAKLPLDPTARDPM